jgi:putative transposase
MATARKNIVDPEVTPYYHCMARCVRRAFLCGRDEVTGKNFDHRKVWIVERIKFLASLFAIQVCGYAILDNHFHLILRILVELVDEWSDEEVRKRAGELCPSTVRGYDDWQESDRRRFIMKWRERFQSISWFMAKLNEFIAVKANKEEGSSGRFWEARFKSKGLLDEGALLASMVYVDLNPVRAGVAQGLDDSSWTSIQQRLREAADELDKETGSSEEMMLELITRIQAEEELVASATQEQPPEESSTAPVNREPLESESPKTLPLEACPDLAPMDPEDESKGLPLSLPQYLELLEWTGRALRDDKRGFIDPEQPPSQLIERCGLDPERWLETVERFGSLGGFVGHPNRLRARATRMNQRWLKGQGRGGRMAYSLEPTSFEQDVSMEYCTEYYDAA